MFLKFIRILLLCFVFGAGFSCVRPVSVEGTAMSPVLKNGEKILLKTNVDRIKRGDIIGFNYPLDTEKYYIKRVIGLPNETVEIQGGDVLIDGTQIEESYVSNELDQAKASFPKVKIPENHYFVIGDNRDNSSDSRYWGTVSKDLIFGVFYMKYFSND